MTDYTKYKKVISKYKFKRILQNRRADLCVVYLIKKVGDDSTPIRVSGVLLDGYLYIANTKFIFTSQSLAGHTDAKEAFRYKVDGKFRSDDIAFFVTRKLYPF